MLRRRNLRLDNGPGWIAENPLAGVVGRCAEREKVRESFFLQLQQPSQTPHTVTLLTKKSHQFQRAHWPPHQCEIESYKVVIKNILKHKQKEKYEDNYNLYQSMFHWK